MKNLIVLFFLFMVSGCANYQFGDGTRLALEAARTVVTLKRDYCAENNAESRELILASIRVIDPDYDPVCWKDN